MVFLQASCTVDESACEAVETLLTGLGAVSITIEPRSDEEEVLEPGPGETPLWQVLLLKALFITDEVPSSLRQRVADVCSETGARDWSVRIVVDREWERSWMDYYHPMRFGSRLWICPSHRRVVDPDALVVHLDPGLAFGTGTHPTTRQCLTWLASQSLETTSVLDYGCGSGILAIAALVLGAPHAVAVDNDHQALVSTRENARHNGVSDRLVVCDPGSLTDHQSDLIIANILSGTLIQLAPTLIERARIGGRIVLSGILERQVVDVCAAYASACPLDTVSVDDGWALLIGTVQG